MLEKLNDYYDLAGISAKSFVNKKLKCKHFEQCSVNKKLFIPAKEAFVSTRYEDHDIPRLLMISLDPKPTIFYEIRDNRTLISIREHEEITPSESYYDWPVNSHWRKTYDVVFILLGEVTAQPDPHPQPLSLKGRGEQKEMGIFCPKGAKNPQTSCFSPPSLQGLRQGMVPR